MTYDPAEIEFMLSDPECWRRALTQRMWRAALSVEQVEKIAPGSVAHAMSLADFHFACDKLNALHEAEGWRAVAERHASRASLQ